MYITWRDDCTGEEAAAGPAPASQRQYDAQSEKARGAAHRTTRDENQLRVTSCKATIGLKRGGHPPANSDVTTTYRAAMRPSMP